MRIFIITILSILASSVFADDHKSYFCSETADMQQRAANTDNELAFTNEGGMKIPLFGKLLGYEDGIGVCWWHSKMQRAALYLAMFRPDLPAPDKDQAIELIEKLKEEKEVVEIPGYNNLREFSSAWAAEFQIVITKWQEEETWAGQWTKAIDANFSDKLNPEQLKKRMDDLYFRMKAGEIVFQRLPFYDSIVVHAWIVFDMEPTEQGYRLKVIDSNQSFDDSGHYEVDYFYGDRYIGHNGSKVVPTFEQNEYETEKFKAARRRYCRNVELIDLTPASSFAEENTAIVSGQKELTDEEAKQLIYTFLTVEGFTYPDFLNVVYSLRSKQEVVLEYFNGLVNHYDDLPVYLSYRISLLVEQYRDMRFDFEDSLLKIIKMPSTSMSVMGPIFKMLLGERGGPTSKAGLGIQMIIERFGMSSGVYFDLLGSLRNTWKKIDNSDYVIDRLVESSYLYDENNDRNIAALLYVVLKYNGNSELLEKVFKRSGVGSTSVLTMAWSIIKFELTSEIDLFERVISHKNCQYDTLETVVSNLKHKWPRVSNDTKILELVRGHPLADKDLISKVDEIKNILSNSEIIQNAIDQLNLDEVFASSSKRYGCWAQVSIDASRLSITNHSFKLNIGCENPMSIKVNFKNLQKKGKIRSLKVEFEAPAHFNYATEKKVFESIFKCDSNGCKDKVNGSIVLSNDKIEIYDTDGIDRNQIHIKGSY